MPDDEIFKIVRQLFEIVPDLLVAQGKAKDPWPNVDAASGSLLYHYGIKEYEFYPVLVRCIENSRIFRTADSCPRNGISYYQTEVGNDRVDKETDLRLNFNN